MRRRRYSKRTNESNTILLTEFRFYNKNKKIIDDKILVDIEKKLLESEKNFLYWTEDNFSKRGYGFILKKITYNETLNVYIDFINLGTSIFTTKQFNNCYEIIKNRFFINYEISDEKLEFLENINFPEIKVHDKMISFNTWEETINYIIENKLLYHNSETYDWKEFLSLIQEIFDVKDIENLKKPQYIKNGYKYYYDFNIYHIFKVIEKRINNKNYRIQLCTVLKQEIYLFKIISEDDKEYTLIDEDRIYFSNKNNKKKYYLEQSTTKKIQQEMYDEEEGKDILKNCIIIESDLFNEMSQNIHEILGENQILINNMIYNFYYERFSRSTNNNIIIDDRQKKINNKYMELIEKGKIIKIDKINIGKNIIYVEDESFKLEFTNEFLNVKENFEHIRRSFNVGDARFNFNLLFERLLELSCLKIIDMNCTQYNEYKNFKKVTFFVNEMEITVSKDDTRIKINDIFCRIADINPILNKLICYNNVEEFNKFVKDVSHIGYEWKRMINNGILLELNNTFYNIFRKNESEIWPNLVLRFSLLWDSEKRSNIFLLLNGKKYLIKYKGKFKKFFDYPKRQLNITKLQQELNECIENLDNNKIIEIIENAIKEGELIQKRGKELVENTIRDISAKETEVDIRGQKMTGYTFNGRRTSSQYFINKSDLNVYKMINGTWDRRCIVDDHNKNRIYEDKLANRLANIYNEPDKLKNFLKTN